MMNIRPQRRLMLAGGVLALCILEPFGLNASGFLDTGKQARTFSEIDALGLPPDAASQLKRALGAHDYAGAEKLLLTEISGDPHSQRAGRLLEFLGGVYFLDHDSWNAAIAWNKAKAIVPLPATINFSLAMAYVRMGRPEWARKALEELAARDGKNALYPYWLGRLDYDAHHYDDAIVKFKEAIQLAPDMAQAWDNLGLCYYRQNENRLAAANFQKAIDLNLKAGRADAWPYLNLAITDRALNQRSEAEAHLREAIHLDPNLAVAHFQLGNVLEDTGRTEEAISEFQTAGRLDTNYAEPHVALARIYRKLGRSADSEREVKIYLRLHAQAKNQTPASPASRP